MRNRQQPFNGYEPGPDFDRARSQIATPFQYFDIALDAATTNQIFNVSGDFIYIDASSTGVATLELNNQYNDPSAPFYVQAGFGLDALFKQIKLSWTAQVGKRLRVMYSTGDRVVPTNSTSINGTVTTTNGGYARTKANQAFLGNGICAAAAANYGHIQLWNPNASGKTLYLESLIISTTTAQQIAYGSYAVALTTLGGVDNILNKNILSADGVAQIRTQINVVQLFNGLAAIPQLAANLSMYFPFVEPVAIPPNSGFIVLAITANIQIGASFEWWEE